MAAESELRRQREHRGESPGAVVRSVADAVVAAVTQSPDKLASSRQVLCAVDWGQVQPRCVADLLDALGAAGPTPPAWLGRAIVLGGHALDGRMERALPALLGALSALNRSATAADVPAHVTRLLADTAGTVGIDADVVTALTRRLLQLGETQVACGFALRWWPDAPAAVRAVRKQIPDFIASLPPLSVRIIGFSTTHGLAEHVATSLAAHGRRPVVAEADFGMALAELHAPAAGRDATLLLLDQDSTFPIDWRGGLDAAGAAIEQRLASLEAAIRAFTARQQTPLVVNTLPASVSPNLGHLDRVLAVGAGRIVDRVNARLAELAADLGSLHLVDADVALAPLSAAHRLDAKLWYYGRFAYSDEATRLLAHAFGRAVHACLRPCAKVVAVDFDNTLWGGVFGDDGVEGLLCGDDFPGSAYKAFQRECLRLRAQGMLLVGLSKNNADAVDVFDRHPGMLLRRADFTACAIDWQPKPDNIRRLAAELNLGLDSFVFLDDSPHEREAMRRMCPAVVVPEMPVDVALRPAWLRSLSETWPLRLTEEDAARAGMYAAHQRARELRETTASYDDYLAALEQRLEVEPLSERTLGRVAQLHQRTNQFNLTTRRFTEADLQRFLRDGASACVLLGDVKDKFGEHGICIAAVATLDEGRARIESFVMSCRVMGRQVEQAFLATLVEHLRRRGIATIEGTYIPSAKNGMVGNFYGSSGFEPTSSRQDRSEWVWRHDGGRIVGSPFVTVEWRTQ